MKRKVISIAGKTFVVSLPNAWVKKNNIQKGDELEITDKENKLIIDTEKYSKSVDLTKSQTFDKRYISDMYKRGYDEIKIKYEDTNILKEIKKMESLGYQIIDQSLNSCIIKYIREESDDFDNTLRKAFRLCKEMGEQISEYFKEEKIDLEQIREFESLNNKLTDECLRQLNKKGYKEGHKTTFLYTITREIETIADIFKYIIDDIKEIKELPNKKIISYYNESFNFFKTFYELFYNFDKNKFNQYYNKRKELIEKGKNLIKEGEINGIIAHHSLNLVVQTYNTTGPFLTMDIENYFWKSTSL